MKNTHISFLLGLLFIFALVCFDGQSWYGVWWRVAVIVAAAYGLWALDKEKPTSAGNTDGR